MVKAVAARKHVAGKEGIDEAAEQLADAVQAQWREESKIRRLQDPWPLPVRWTASDPELADHLESVLASPATQRRDNTVSNFYLSGKLDEAVDAFERLPHKRLVVLGPPGSGKSVFAMVLTLEILARRKPGSPVPVLFPIAAWIPSNETLHEWMTDYLAENYQLAGAESQEYQSTARNLVTGDRLLPILDGLDEIADHLRPAALLQLNHSLSQGQPLVLTCRDEEYRDAVERGDVLTLAAVVQLQPLDPATVMKYLLETTPTGRRSAKWEPVFEHLKAKPGGALAMVLRTPLMISLARTIYGENPRDPAELLEEPLQNFVTLEQHLLDQVIPATYPDRHDQSPGRRVLWNADEVTSWLTFLSRHQSPSNSSDIAWWQLEVAVPRIVNKLAEGLLGGLVVGIVFGPVIGVSFAAVAALAATFSRRGQPTLEAWLTGRLDYWVDHLVKRRLVGHLVTAVGGLREKVPIERRLGLALGRFAGMSAGLGYGLLVYEAQGLARAVANSVAIALAVGLAVGFFTISHRSTPREVQFAARKGIGIFARRLTARLATGLGAGIIFSVLVGSSFCVIIGLAIGLALGLNDGLNVWLDVSTDVTRALSPMSTLRADRLAAIARGAIIGVVIASTSGVAFGLAYGPRSALVHALGFGIGYALGDRYQGIGATAWGRYMVAKAWLALQGRLPWRLMGFLGDVHKHELLRQVGAVYQFRHVRLQERLAQSGICNNEFASAAG
jgi:DNA polymerase III delta prime subunit